MPVCTRCHTDVGLLGRLSFNAQKGRCGKCERDVHQALLQYRAAFLKAAEDAVLTGQEWSRLNAIVYENHLDINETPRCRPLGTCCAELHEQLVAVELHRRNFFEPRPQPL